MKKFVSFCTLALFSAICLAGCGNSSSAESETSAVSESSTATVYSTAPTYSDRYWIADMSFTTDDGLPFNYRTMEDEFGSVKMPLPPMGDGATTEVTEATTQTTEAAEEDYPSREGMDTLNMSGSSEYNADSFQAMIEDIRSLTDGEICVFDLREETHGFVNGEPVSLYAKHNTGNVGLNTEEVLALEKEQLGELLNTELTLKTLKPSKKGETSETGSVVDVDDVMTEQELCESQDVEYVRIACTDHLCPEDEDVDEFMDAYLALPEGTWLHFHCAAGVGRTGLFMMMADMLRNPDVSLDDIISRQSLLGASDPRDPMGMESEGTDDKIDLLERFYEYVQEEQSAGFPVTFTEWSQSK